MTRHRGSECQPDIGVSWGMFVIAGTSSSTFLPISDTVWEDNHRVRSGFGTGKKGERATFKRVSICTFTLSVVAAWDFEVFSSSSFSCASSLTFRSSLTNVRK